MTRTLKEEHLFHMLNPDGNSGSGYGTTLSKINKLGVGHKDFPYGWEEESKWDKEKDKLDFDLDDIGFDDVADVDKFSNKVGNAHSVADPAGRYTYDRTSFVDGQTRGISEVFRELIALMVEDVFRLRGASSEPESLGSDAWPGAAPPKYSLKPQKPAWTLKAVMTKDEDQLDQYDGDVDSDDPAEMFDFQERNSEWD